MKPLTRLTEFFRTTNDSVSEDNKQRFVKFQVKYDSIAVEHAMLKDITDCIRELEFDFGSRYYWR